MIRRRIVAWGLVLAACQSTPPASHLLPRPSSPVRVSWQEVDRQPTQVKLIARVQRSSPLRFPLVVTLRAPAGVALASGRARFTLTPNAEGTVDDEAVTFTYETIPQGDLELLADGEAIDVGIHARKKYRFGRPEPQLEVVAPTGPDLKFGEKNLGPSVPIRPR